METRGEWRHVLMLGINGRQEILLMETKLQVHEHSNLAIVSLVKTWSQALFKRVVGRILVGAGN